MAGPGPEHDAVARLLALDVVVRPGDDSDAPLTRADWGALPATPEGVRLLWRQGEAQYREQVQAEWDAPLGAELTRSGLLHLSHYTPLVETPEAPLRRAVAEMLHAHAPGRSDGVTRLGVDLGCSVGPDTAALAAVTDVVLAADGYVVPVRWLAQRLSASPPSVVRRVHGGRFEGAPLADTATPLPVERVVPVIANALDPPLRAGRADVVVAVNLLDNTVEPVRLLAQAHRMLAPGGLLLLASPFHWNDAMTPWQQQLCTLFPDRTGPEAVRALLAGQLDERVAGLDLEVLEEREATWVVQNHPRCRIHYDVWVVAARRPGDGRLAV